MDYKEFKKQAGFGDVVSWGIDKARDNFSLGTEGGPLQSLNINFRPFATNDQPADYTGMNANQKFDTFQQDVHRAANKNIGIKDAYNAFSDDVTKWGIINPLNPVGSVINTAKNIYNYATTGKSTPSAVGQLRDNALMSEGVQQAADQFIASSDISDIPTYQKRIEQMASSMPNSEAANAFKQYVTDGLKTRVWDGIKSNPIKNIPLAASMFLRQYGLGKAADFLSNPIAFYGSLVGVLGGAKLLFGGRDGNSPVVNNYYNRVPYE
jgi:hypothetical protein